MCARSHSLPAACQRGQALAEFTFVAFAVIVLGLGSVELAHWFFVRQGVSIALMDAGRAAITGHNQPERIIQGFERALSPLYVSAAGPQAARQRVQYALARRSQDLASAPWQIEVLSPSAAAFADFSDPSLAPPPPRINNNYLAEQASRHRARGWPQGLGPQSGQNIYQANTLVLRLSWPHRPKLAWLRRLLATLGHPEGSYRQRALARGYLPIVRQATLLMQSHPVQWPDHASGKVLFGAESKGAVAGTATASAVDGTRPLPPARSGPAKPPTATPAAPDARPNAQGQGQGSSPPAILPGPPPGASGPETAGLSPGPDDPACGTVLCCG